jgi:hypothetical protein
MNEDRYSGLRATPTFRDQGLAKWQAARLGIIGCGAIGSRLAPEAVRSGTQVWLCDFEQAEPHNLGTQAVRAGRPKVEAVIEACEAIRTGAARGVCVDVRHVGIGVLRHCDVLVDCTDDRLLEVPLTGISNGLGIPLLRVAVDGTGRWELGRVLCSDARDGGACQMCPHAFDELRADATRMRCPGVATHERPPTLAGGALATTLAGLALLQAQRLVTGNDLELVWNREVIVDWSHLTIMAAEVRRSRDCLSGHIEWTLDDFSLEDVATLGQLFAAALRRLGTADVRIEPYGHPLCQEAICNCGVAQVAVGTVWATPPACPSCGGLMEWRTETQRTCLTRRQARELGVWDHPLGDLGFPDEGAMFVARAEGQPAARLVLRGAASTKRGDRHV